MSALVALALQEGDVSGAILTGRRGDLEGEGRCVSTREAVHACGGSRFAAAPTLAAFNRTVAQGARELCVVGMPCQMQALALMDAPRQSHATLRIGLFCTWAFDLRRLRARLRPLLGSRFIVDLRVTPPPERSLEIEAEGEAWSIPLDAVRTCIQPACETCWDMTAELADLSVGTAEDAPGWNTLLVRTSVGADIVDRAVHASVLEVNAIANADLEHLRGASLDKKRKALEGCGPQGYLHVGAGLRSALSGGPGAAP